METPQKQKDALRLLMAFQKELPIEYFYSISITRWGRLELHGNFKTELVAWALKHKFVIGANDFSGYISLKKGNVEIRLT